MQLRDVLSWDNTFTVILCLASTKRLTEFAAKIPHYWIVMLWHLCWWCDTPALAAPGESTDAVGAVQLALPLLASRQQEKSRNWLQYKPVKENRRWHGELQSLRRECRTQETGKRHGTRERGPRWHRGQKKLRDRGRATGKEPRVIEEDKEGAWNKQNHFRLL